MSQRPDPERPRERAGERGWAVPIALLAVAVVTALGAASLDHARRAGVEVQQEVGEAQTRQSLMGAVDWARLRLGEDAEWSGGPIEVGGRVITVEVEPARPGVWSVRARDAGGGRCEARLDSSVESGLPRITSWRD